ncbi:AP2-associated protein kinase, putative [Entamoeba invadens IP1]|uniref:AP2-associated protein kinase, putative n=1 Tax=Entamoeba invadens IP1 TaxID=370355 RepID=UPI0002C3DD3D|nr:AP2-associated protein kinase, putative [Entamoeba invadens IP1]ELP93941.1 AP2-associated protein kinase, putative [Entamoeba invadens IP1]|eukprot:XP_004260712.1 AP2-associated protein kinase, putative [Entamoeba invadens IP1]
MGNVVTIGREQVFVERKLGSGGFSQVYFAKSQETNREYAMKVMFYADQTDLQRIKKEIEVHKLLTKNEYVVPLIESCIFQEPERKVVMLLDYCPVSTINVLERSYPHPIKEDAVLRIFYQVCHAVAYMHSQNPPLCHRDLKVENVLFKNKKFLLTDFGSVVPESAFYNRKRGDCPGIDENIQKYTTLAYRAPEMINLYDYKPIGRKADVWALGCVLFKLCYFDTPFEESPMKIQFCKYSVPNANFSEKVTQFFTKIFVVDPAERISVFQIMDILAKELNLPNPYANLVGQKDQVAEVTDDVLKPVPAQIKSAEPMQSKSAGLFWDNVKDVPTQADDTLKAPIKQHITGEKKEMRTTSEPPSKNLLEIGVEAPKAKTPLTTSTDLFNFQEPLKESKSPQNSNMTNSMDLFSFEDTTRKSVITEKKNTIIDFGTPSRNHVVISSSPQPQKTTQQNKIGEVKSASVSPALFDFSGEFHTGEAPKASTKSTSKSSNDTGDLFSKLDFSKQRKTPPVASQETFWSTPNQSFDFQGKW